MSYVSWVLMAAAGLAMIAVGVGRKKKWETASGCCFVGVAVFGYMSRFNEMYAWVQLSFAILCLVSVLVGIFTRRKSA